MHHQFLVPRQAVDGAGFELSASSAHGKTPSNQSRLTRPHHTLALLRRRSRWGCNSVHKCESYTYTRHASDAFVLHAVHKACQQIEQRILVC